MLSGAWSWGGDLALWGPIGRKAPTSTFVGWPPALHYTSSASGQKIMSSPGSFGYSPFYMCEKHLNLRKAKVLAESLVLLSVYCCSDFSAKCIFGIDFFYINKLNAYKFTRDSPIHGLLHILSPGHPAQTTHYSRRKERKENHNSFSCDFVAAKGLRLFLSTAVPPAWPGYQCTSWKSLLLRSC